jgi:hypothetical protein
MNLPSDALARIVSVFDTADLGDPRRLERVKHTVRKLAESPQSTLPEAMGSEAEIEGAYRLFQNEHVTLETLMQAYAKATADRAREVGRVLAIHDTTTCSFAHADPEAVGYLPTGKAGFMAHYSLVVADNPSHQPLGIVNIEAEDRKTNAVPQAKSEIT